MDVTLIIIIIFFFSSCLLFVTAVSIDVILYNTQCTTKTSPTLIYVRENLNKKKTHVFSKQTTSYKI